MEKDMRGATLQILCFGVVASVLYLLGYWHTFGIIIFEYANFKDIIIASMILMSSGLVIYVTGFAMGSLFYPKNRNNNIMTVREINQKLDEYDEIDKHDPPFGPDDIAERKLTFKEMRRSLAKIEENKRETDKTILGRAALWLYKTKISSFLQGRYSQIAPIFMSLYVILLTVIGLMPFHSFQTKAVVFGGLCAVGGFWAVYESKFLAEVKDNRVRILLIHVLFLALSSSYFFGKDRAQKILDDGPNTSYEAMSGRKYLGSSPKSSVKR